MLHREAGSIFGVNSQSSVSIWKQEKHVDGQTRWFQAPNVIKIRADGSELDTPTLSLE